MTDPQTPPAAYRGNRHRTMRDLLAWHAGHAPEAVLEPRLPIVDPHHHLYGSKAEDNHYTWEDLGSDLGAGHRVMGTVYLEAYDSGWRTAGPPELCSTGEVEMIVRESGKGPLRTPWGECQVAAGIVSNVDLLQGDATASVLAAHTAAAQGRLRGVRHHLTHDTGAAGRFVYNKPPRLAYDSQFRRGFACVQEAGLSFDVFIFHTQLDELADLARAFPRTPIILNHVGTMIHVAEFAGRREAVIADWQRQMRGLAQLPNVFVKVGGLGMPIFGFGFEHADRPARSDGLVAAWQDIIDFCVDLFGASRCMFESNFPVDKQPCGYVELWNAFKRATARRNAAERQDLFYRTACRVYRLPELERACDHASQEYA